MTHRSAAWALLAVSMVGQAAHAACPSGLPVARVERIDAAPAAAAPARVAGDGSRAPLRPYDWLCPGDRIELNGAQRLVAVGAGGAELVFAPGSMPALPPPAAAPAARSPGLVDLAAEVLDRLAGARKPIALFNQARDPGQTQPPLQADPLLPAGEQRLPRSTARAALLWRGGPALLVVQADGQAAQTVSSGRRAYAVVELPRDAPGLLLRTLDNDLQWPITWTDEAVPADADQRLRQALQLLRDGAPQRRLFALSELAALSAQGSFAAQQLWAAARSGELADALGLR